MTVDRAHELLVNRNHAYLLGDLKRHGIPMGYHLAVANIIREYTQTKENK